MTLEKAIDLLESYDFEEGHPDLTQAALSMEGCGESWIPYRRKPETPADEKEEEIS